MLAATVLARRTLLATSTSSWCRQQQQARFLRTKTFGLRFRFGQKPIVSASEYMEVEEAGELEKMQFESVRFALSRESTSPLRDPKIDQIISFAMRHGRRALLEHMMHEACYHIKRIQYGKMLKREQRAAAAAAAAAAGKDKAKGQVKAPQEEEEEEQAIELDPIVIVKQALLNMQPAVITRKITRGGATYNVPYPLTEGGAQYLAIKWLVEAVMERPKPRKKQFPEAFAQEILDGFANTGKVVKRKDDLHRLAVANKPFAHYRWG